MSSIIYEKRNRIAYITLNRPEVFNGYNNAMLRELEKVWYDFRDDPEVWVAVLTGAGRHFCVGHALDSLHEVTEPEPPSIHYGTIEIFKPIIAAVNGNAMGGGCSMALGCDIRIAADNARFGYPQTQVGHMSLGGHQRLPRMTHPGIALEMMLTGDAIDAQQALQLGLVNHIAPVTNLMAEATKLAEKIAGNGPLAVRATKEAFVRGQTMPIQQGIRMAALLYRGLINTEDAQEGLKAFKEKRKPNYKGK
mgnify:FL=1